MLISDALTVRWGAGSGGDSFAGGLDARAAPPGPAPLGQNRGSRRGSKGAEMGAKKGALERAPIPERAQLSYQQLLV